MSAADGPAGAARPYESFAELQDAYLKLSSRYHEQRSAPTAALRGEVGEFIDRGAATGVLLERASERRAARSMLDYWGSVLLGLGREEPLITTLRSFDPAQAPELSDKLCPYVGLNAFDERTAPYFYGRDELCAAVTAELGRRQVVVVVGPSGSGKSSIVRAGVLPRLRLQAQAAGQSLVVEELVPGSAPRLPELPAGTLLFVDQFEELFTLCDRATQRQFIEALEQALRSPGLRVILTIRSDFESYLVKYDSLNRPGSHLPVPALSAAELRAAIERPAAAVGLVYSPGVVETLMGELLGEPAGLPLLQFTLLRLWKKKERNRVTMDAYREVGCGRRALAKHADEVFKQFLNEKESTARRILLRLGRPLDGYGAEVTRSRVKLQEVYASNEDPARIAAVVKTLSDEGLIRHTGSLELPVEDQQIEIAHEALVRNWPLFAEWLEKEKATIEKRRRWETLLSEWKRLGKTDTSLLEEAQVRELKEWLESPAAQDVGYDRDLPLFLAESQRRHAQQLQAQREQAQRREAEQQRRLAEAEALATAERAAKEAKARELEEARARAELERFLRETKAAAEQQHQRRLRWGVFVLACFALFSSYLALRADRASTAAKQSEDRAKTESLQAKTALADKEREKAEKELHQQERDTTQVLLLAMQNRDNYRRYLRILQERLRSQPSASKRSALYQYLATQPTATPFEPPADGYKGEYLQGLIGPSGKYVYALTKTGKILIWGMDGHAVRTHESDPKRRGDVKLDRIILSPEGNELAGFSRTGSVISRWSALGEQQSELRPSSGMVVKLHDVAYSGDGRYVAALYADGTVVIWARKDGAIIYTLSNKEYRAGAATGFAISRDGTRVLVTVDGEGHLWTLTSNSAGCRVQSLLPSTSNPGPAESVAGGRFSSDGNRFYGYTTGGSVHSWDFTEGKQDKCKTTTSKAVSEYRTGKPLRGLALSPDDSRLIVFESTGAIQQYEPQTLGTQAPVLRECSGRVLGAEYAPNSTSLLLFTDRGRICIFGKQGPGKMFPGAAEPKLQGLAAAHFTPDGSAILTLSAVGDVKLWNLDGMPMNLAPPLPRMAGHTMGVNVGEFSNRGDYLATGSFDGTAQIWKRTPDNEWQRLGRIQHKYAVRMISMSPDDTRVLTASYDQYVHVWNLDGSCPSERPRCVTSFNVLPSARIESIITPIAFFAGDAAHILVGSAEHRSDAQVRLFNLDTGAVERSVKIASPNVSLSRSGSLVYATDVDRITVYKADSSEPLATIKHQARIADNAYCSRQGLLATISDDGDIKLFSVAQRAVRNEFTVAANPIEVQFSDDCEQLLIVWAGQPAQLFSAQGKRKAIFRPQGRATPLSGALSGSGRFLAFALSDNSVELWENTELRARWRAHADQILTMEFDPREQWLLTTSSDRTGRLWPTTDELVNQIIDKYSPSPIGEEDKAMWLGGGG